MEEQLKDLPANVSITLADFVETAQEACGSNLVSVVLFGSAAEGRLRPSSDVNVILVFKEFHIPQVNQLREKLRVASAAIRMNTMFLLESELAIATEAFAVKFNDIMNRHRILYGVNPFAHLEVSRTATIQRLKQVVFNLILRLRERYALVSLREEQLVTIVADATGPIRACAANILGLEGKKFSHPKEALQILTEVLPPNNWSEILSKMSTAREDQALAPGAATATVLGVLELLNAMLKHIQDLK